MFIQYTLCMVSHELRRTLNRRFWSAQTTQHMKKISKFLVVAAIAVALTAFTLSAQALTIAKADTSPQTQVQNAPTPTVPPADTSPQLAVFAIAVAQVDSLASLAVYGQGQASLAVFVVTSLGQFKVNPAKNGATRVITDTSPQDLANGQNIVVAQLAGQNQTLNSVATTGINEQGAFTDTTHVVFNANVQNSNAPNQTTTVATTANIQANHHSVMSILTSAPTFNLNTTTPVLTDNTTQAITVQGESNAAIKADTDVVAKVPTSLGFNGNTEASIATVTTHTIAGTLALTQAQLQHATVDIGASNHEVGCGYGVEAVT